MTQPSAETAILETAAMPWRAPAAGLCAILVGIGVGRFAYTPLVPAVIGAGWFTASQAVYLGAANLAGYLAGALVARQAAARLPAHRVLQAMMLLTALSFFACAVPVVPWFFVWRFAAGAAGAVIMVVGAPAVLASVAPKRRGLAGGVMFTGVGLGIIASGTLMPLLLRAGLTETWGGLGAISLVLTVLSWNAWPRQPAPPRAASGQRQSLRAWAVVVEYGLNAFGLVPHMLFLSVFIARGLGRGVDAGSRYWIVLGIGAMAGPLLAGRVADAIGFTTALRLSFPLQAVVVGLPILWQSAFALTVSSLVTGAFIPGIALLALGRVQDLLQGEAERQRALWSYATTSFALFQAIGGYALAALFAATGESYNALFASGAAAMLVALAIDLGVHARGVHARRAG